MSDLQIVSVLERLGLKEKEAQIYYSALTLGPSSVLALSRAAGIKRTTAYSVIAELQERGLMHKQLVGIKERWAATDPETLHQLLEQRQKELSAILPQLHALKKLEGAESVIKYYEGIDALKGIYNQNLTMMKSGQEYLVLGSGNHFVDMDPEFFMDFLRRRAKLNIRVRMILTDDEWSRNRAGRGRFQNEETRLLPKGVTLTTNLVIIPTRVFVQQLVDPVLGMVIENSHFVRMHREMYELMWSGLPGHSQTGI